MPFTINAETDPDPADVAAIRDGLETFNNSHVPPGHFMPLTLVLRDEAGDVAGGLLGATYWGWLYVEIVWLSEKARGAGHGSALLAHAEHEARRRGCRNVYLDTMDWQALPFYRKQGYLVWGQLDDFPAGHTRYFLRKALA
jgi:GNAT superfamily N-acetyltransferase